MRVNFQFGVVATVIIFLCHFVRRVKGQQDGPVCYGGGSIATAVILSVIFTAVILVVAYYWWQRRKTAKEHLILETDPEKGKGEFAFDNPGFKDTSNIFPTNTTITTPEKKSKLEAALPNKWNQWSPLNALSLKSEKRKTLDDSALEESEVKVVALRSHDFTGLGFNICGNIKEGIYIKDILHRGPAFESGKLNPGDKITSVTISFEHMVCEDALTILSYASPYEVIIEARSGKFIHNDTSQGAQPGHPVYRSSSCTDLVYGEKKGIFGGDFSSLQKSRSNLPTLERKKSKSPKPVNNVSVSNNKKHPLKHLSPKQLKTQLEHKIAAENHTPSPLQKSENKYQKFGVKVLPFEQKSPKSAEQNENNINIEKTETILSIDEVDEIKPQVKKREKKSDSSFVKNGVLNGSGIKRDKNGIPQEIPEHMLNAAVAARRNRKSSYDTNQVMNADDSPKKKGKAPAPPPEVPARTYHFDEMNLPEEKLPEYNSDSDVETDNNSSVNTIELNSSDITIHQAEDENMQNRKTASTGDLTKIQKLEKSSTGTLERAQSLDNTETGMSTLKRKGDKLDDEEFGQVMLNKAPRLSLILDSLNTFQRNSLKKSTEWGNLEDALLKLNQEEEHANFKDVTSEMHFNFGEKSPEFDALVKKINEIKGEEVVVVTVAEEKKVKNQIWPSKFELVEGPISAQSRIEEVTVTNKPILESKPILSSFEVETVKPVLKSITIDKPVPITASIKPILEASKQTEVIKPVEATKIITEAENVKPVSSSVNITKIQNATETKPVTPLKPIINSSNAENFKPVTTFNIDPKPVSVTLNENQPIIEPIIQKRQIIIEHDCEQPVTEVSTEKWEVSINETPTNLKSSTILNQDDPKSDETKLSQENSYHPNGNASLDEINEAANLNLVNVTENFLFTERINACKDDYNYIKSDDTNISDDLKVSRHSYESLERSKVAPKSDDAKSEHISSVTVNNGDGELHSLELSVNDLYTTALENPVVTFSIPSVSLNTTDEDSENASLTYITEIKVTPNSSTKSNVSEIEIIRATTNITSRNLDNEFENYVKNFECNFEPTIENFETSLDEFKDEPTSITISNDAEHELHKIQEIAEEQLKKLPEMRFVTSSYEDSKPVAEPRSSQIEILRMNFEKSPPRFTPNKPEVVSKSRIPVATSNKTPPISPERRDSRNLDMENDTAILELMSSTVHSTPIVSKYQIKSPSSKNVTVTSIRSNSKIPSGLPTLGGGSRLVSPRKMSDAESVEGHESHYVYNNNNRPSNNSITNISLMDGKRKL